MARNKFTQEFTKKNLLLTHLSPQQFYTAQWRWPGLVYTLYRVVVAIFFTVWLILTGVFTDNSVKWFIYLTNWSFFMLTINTIMMASTAVYGYVVTMKKKNTDDTSKPAMLAAFKMQWVIYNIATCIAPLVTIVYWGALYTNGSVISATNFMVHAFNSIYIIIELFITATPVRLLHVWHTAVFGAIYLVFTLIYCGAGGTNPFDEPWIYPILDFYGRPTTAAIVTLGCFLVALPLLWLVVFGLFCLRGLLSERCCGKYNTEVEPTQDNTQTPNGHVNDGFAEP